MSTDLLMFGLSQRTVVQTLGLSMERVVEMFRKLCHAEGLSSEGTEKFLNETGLGDNRNG
jgi:hypothetical protein